MIDLFTDEDIRLFRNDDHRTDLQRLKIGLTEIDSTIGQINHLSQDDFIEICDIIHDLSKSLRQALERNKENQE